MEMNVSDGNQINVRRKSKKIGNNIRKLIITKYEENETCNSIATALHLKYQTVYSIIRLYKNSGRVLSLHTHNGRGKKLTEACLNSLFMLMRDDCSITLNEIKTKLFKMNNITVSVSTINRALKHFHYSFKRISLIPERRNTVETINKRFEYALIAMNYDPAKTYYLDEMGVSFVMRCGYGRALIGQSPRKIIASVKSKNFSVAAAIGLNGVILYEAQPNPFNTISFGDFVNKLCDIFESNSIKNAIFVLDNVAFHKSPDIASKIEIRGHTIIFIPPYSPQLNPIEEVFSKWKCLIKSKNCQNQEELLTYISECGNEISENDVMGYYSHTREFLIKSILKEEF